MGDRRFTAVLFDLDGTLADTAPDLIGALNAVRGELGLAAADETALRPVVAGGALAILDQGLPEVAPEERARWRGRFLDHYRDHCWDRSRPFPGIEALLGRLEGSGLSWGIVTNKLAFLADPVARAAGWRGRAGCLVCGDSVAAPKPAPDPVLAACRALAASPDQTLFVGDDRRDVVAGRAAGTATAVAAWGYIPAAEKPAGWGADYLFEDPEALGRALESSLAGCIQ